MANKSIKKPAPFAKALQERQQFNNLPFLVAVCVGAGAWDSAKARNKRGDSVGLVLPSGKSPGSYVWPVGHCLVVIEWNTGPGVELVVDLAKSLLQAGAESVTIWPRWVDYSQPNLEWPTCQPPIKTYRLRQSSGMAYAA
jgi:hypothetical protein